MLIVLYCARFKMGNKIKKKKERAGKGEADKAVGGNQ